MKFKTLMLSIALAGTMSAGASEVIAHRGNWKTPGAYQNTIAALVASDSTAYYGSEFDVWLTADNQLVVHHDDKAYGTDVMIQDAARADFADVRLPNGEAIPSLANFLAAAQKTKVKLIFELKPHRDAAREREAVSCSIELLKRYGLLERTEFITFSKNALLEFIRLSDRPAYYLNGEMTPAELKEVGAAGADYHHSVFKAHPEWIEECHKLGMKVNAWTVDKDEDIRWCIDNGVDFITTNVPFKVREMIDK